MSRKKSYLTVEDHGADPYRIHVSALRSVPEGHGDGVCVYGTPEDAVGRWVLEHGLVMSASGPFTNIHLPQGAPLHEWLVPPPVFEWLDGFSPNLNKHLHIGHLSNFILAKAFQCMGVARRTVALLGDTVHGSVQHDDAHEAFIRYCTTFGYRLDLVFKASHMVYPFPLESGSGSYAGTLVFRIGEKQVVAQKSDGTSTYFLHDAALASTLNAPTLILTGNEQNEHFKDVAALFPNVHHLGLGLVLYKGRKGGSRNGDMVMATEVFDALGGVFPASELQYNAIAGRILESTPRTNKQLDMEQVLDVQRSPGLYLSYTTARMRKAGVPVNVRDHFHNHDLTLALFRARTDLAPNVLLKELVRHAGRMNRLYGELPIRNNPANQAVFADLLSDLLLGMRVLGLFNIETV